MFRLSNFRLDRLPDSAAGCGTSLKSVYTLHSQTASQQADVNHVTPKVLALEIEVSLDNLKILMRESNSASPRVRNLPSGRLISAMGGVPRAEMPIPYLDAGE